MTFSCDCAEACRLEDWSDQFQPATRELLVFTKSAKRFFDLDAVRTEHSRTNFGNLTPNKVTGSRNDDGKSYYTDSNPAGAPPLDWWLIPHTEPYPFPQQGEPMTATFYVGDAIKVMDRLPEKSVDLILTSPPFLALRSYLPADHPDKKLEGGSQSTPGEYIDWLLDVVEACTRVLAPHGSLVFELGDTYSGSGGGGGDYLEGGWREGQAQFAGSAASMKESNAAHWRQKNTLKDAWPLAKSLSLIPETFRFAMVYGHNPHTGRTTAPWRLRNVIRWVRPNPPVGALGDKFRPATSELMVFCKAKDRYFDLDSVREGFARDYDGEKRGSAKFDGKHDGSGYDPALMGADLKMTHAGAPPLDWWKIPEASVLRHPCEHGRYERHSINPGDLSRCPGGEFLLHNPQAPPLDWWNIPPGGYSGFTTWTTKVPVDPATYDGFSGDIQRTASADCPEHGDRADQTSTESHDGRAGIESNRSRGNGDRPARGLAPDSVPIDQLPLLNLEAGSLDSPLPRSTLAATPRSKPSRKKAPVPATSPLDTPSEETRSRIDDTSGSPSSDGLSLDSPENRTVEADPSSAGHETAADTDRISGQPLACTCSYFVEKANTTSHYAVWPPELLIKPIKAMSPERVCRTCGQPSRRIVEQSTEYREARESVNLGLDASRSGREVPARGGGGIGFGGGASSLISNGKISASPATVGWTDCSHDDWRPGLVLDPFAGTGTTLAVATGHSRDAIGIDLDERNYDLALERVGPLVLTRGEVAA